MPDQFDDQFRALGVNDPEEWARSQREEGIDQIARATILRALADIAASAPRTWDAQRNHATPAVMAAAARIAEIGVPEDDLAKVLQATAWEMIFEIVALFGGATEPDINPANVSFTVRRTDEEEFEPIGDELMLHESWREVAARILGEEVVRA